MNVLMGKLSFRNRRLGTLHTAHISIPYRNAEQVYTVFRQGIEKGAVYNTEVDCGNLAPTTKGGGRRV